MNNQKYLYEIKTYTEQDNRILWDINMFKDGGVDGFSTIFYMEMLAKITDKEFIEIMFSNLCEQEIREIIEPQLTGRFTIRRLNVATTYMSGSEDYLIFRSIAGKRAILMQKGTNGRWEFICGLNTFNQEVKIVEIDNHVFRDLYCVLKLTG